MLIDYLVHINNVVGLLDTDANKAIDMLNNSRYYGVELILGY
jgi:hypothetical protein